MNETQSEPRSQCELRKRSKDAKKRFANLIRSYRCKAGISQLALSYEIGRCTNSLVSLAENGARVPSPAMALKIARVLSIPEEEVFNHLVAVAAENIRAKMGVVELS